jgi:esterase
MTNVTDELIELRGLRFHYRNWAPAVTNAPTLVLLHGYTGHSRTWDAFAEPLSGKYRVLALDLRGHGESQWDPAGNYATREMVADLEAFVAALGLREFALVGLSMGGIVSIGYSGQRPAALARLVLVDIGPEIDKAGLRRINRNVARADVFASPEAAFVQEREANAVPPEAHHRYRVNHGLMRTEDGQWTFRYDRALRSGVPRDGIGRQEGWQLVANIQVPTLLLRGENSDILSAAVAQRMVADIVDCDFQLVAGSGHPIPLDQPQLFIEALQRFL